MRLSHEPSKIPPLIEYPVETAFEFVECLALHGPLFGKYRPGDAEWAFRGNGEVFPLVPSALRPKAEFMTSDSGGRWREIGEDCTYAQRAECELWTLSIFFQEADRQGLRLPEDSQHFRANLPHILEALKLANKPWPPLELLSLMAIAQHHGIPTRLLDWSRDPFVAAYFAAIGATQKLGKLLPSDMEMRDFNFSRPPQELDGKRLEVWAINLVAAVENQFFHQDIPHIRVVTAPRAGNENLYAQRGLFTMPIEPGPPPWDSKEPYVIVPLEKLAQGWPRPYLLAPFLIHITLPIHLGPQLLGLLARWGTTAARLFPGYDGIVKSLLERSLLDDDFLIILSCDHFMRSQHRGMYRNASPDRLVL